MDVPEMRTYDAIANATDQTCPLFSIESMSGGDLYLVPCKWGLRQ